MLFFLFIYYIAPVYHYKYLEVEERNQRPISGKQNASSIDASNTPGAVATEETTLATADILGTSVGDPDPDPDDPHVRIRIH